MTAPSAGGSCTVMDSSPLVSSNRQRRAVRGPAAVPSSSSSPGMREPTAAQNRSACAAVISAHMSTRPASV
jgi:hypothetical protein